MKRIKQLLALVLFLGLIFCMQTSAKAEDLQQPSTVSAFCTDSDGNVYIADSRSHCIWKQSTDGTYSVVVGQPGISGYADGKPGKTLLSNPWGIAPYLNGFLITDTGNQALRYYDGTYLITLKTTGVSLNTPTGITAGPDGSVFLSDTSASCIKQLDTNGNLSLYAGAENKSGCKDGNRLQAARFESPTGLYYYNKTLYIADSGNHRIVSIKNDSVKTRAGSPVGQEGDRLHKTATKGLLSNPQNILVYKKTIYIADTGNGCVKKWNGGKLLSVLPTASRKNNTVPIEPKAFLVKDGKFWVGDDFTGDILKLKIR